jgi:hypothetical protein
MQKRTLLLLILFVVESVASIVLVRTDLYREAPPFLAEVSAAGPDICDGYNTSDVNKPGDFPSYAGQSLFEQQ